MNWLRLWKGLLGLLAVLSGLLTAALTALWWHRSSLPYNSEDRFFDEASGVVYHQQAVVVYGMMAVVFAVLTAVLVWGFRRVSA